MKIIVIGKNGQVSRHLRRVLGDKADYIARAELDLAHVSRVYDYFMATGAQVIINAAAYTDTQLAESEPGLAYAVNAAGVAEVARAANDLKALLVHISTDYVFDGEKKGAYLTTDKPNPISVYGESKLLGERLIAATCPNHIILRTSWVFSEYGRNFVKTIATLAQEREVLEVVANQRGCPTYAGHLAKVIGELLVRYQQKQQAGAETPTGIYHYADSAACSWYAFAEAIVAGLTERNGAKAYAQLEPIDREAWPSVIRRPENGELDCQKLEADWGIARYDWRDILPTVLANL